MFILLVYTLFMPEFVSTYEQKFCFRRVKIIQSEIRNYCLLILYSYFFTFAPIHLFLFILGFSHNSMMLQISPLLHALLFLCYYSITALCALYSKGFYVGIHRIRELPRPGYARYYLVEYGKLLTVWMVGSEEYENVVITDCRNELLFEIVKMDGKS